ncbi:MAG: M16 family metallopeptidase, partial [Thermoanaerobaculia bacterium]
MSNQDFRATAPSPADPRQYRFPDVHRHELPNGLKLLLAVRSSAPVMTVRAVVHSGAEHDPLDQPGIAVFTAEMLEEGAAGRGSMEIAGEVAELGAALYCGADWDASLVSIDALGRHLDATIALAGDLVRSPEFPPNELERMRKERLTAILQQKDDPSVIAAHLFNRFVFGRT